MNSLKNHVQLAGNLGRAPEIRTFEDGKKVARFSMATNEKYKNNKGELVTETYWHNIVARGRQADTAERYLDKGSEVVISGRLVNRMYTDKNGAKRYVTEVFLTDILVTSRNAA